MKKIYKKIISKNINIIIFMIILTLFSSINIFSKEIIFGHDTNFHLHRILAMTENIRIGKYIPVYFNYLNGFGYANGLFYPDIFLIIPGFLNYIGLGLKLSYKIFILLINFASIFTMYLCVYRISKEKKCGIIAMILYAVSTYRLIDYVERSALGEMLAFIFIPIVILGIYEILYGNEKQGFYLTVGLSCLCYSHVISFYITCIFMTILVLVNIKCLKEKNRLKQLCLNLLASILITSHFWAPMLEQIIQYEFNLKAYDPFYDNIVPLLALFIDFPLITLYKTWFPPGIGLIYYVYIKKIIKETQHNKFIFTLALFGIISIILSTSNLIWKINIFYKVFNIIQFPWRFYMFATVFLIISFSIMMKNIKFNKNIKIYFIYTIIIFMIDSLIHLNALTITGPLKGEIMFGEYLPKEFNTEIVNDYKTKDYTYERNKNILTIDLKKEKNNVEVPLIFYKGYKACSENECFKTKKNKNGLLEIETNKTKTKINIEYKGTNIYNISKYTTLLGLGIFVYISIKKGHKKYE